MEYCAGRDHLAVSSVTYADLAARARTQEGVDEELDGFHRLPQDFTARRVGMYRVGR